MKALPAVFFPKHPRWLLAALATLSAPGVEAQGYPPAGAGMGAPGAVQQPYYRQSGSAYVPPGTTPRSSPQYQTGQYQPGFGTPPNSKSPGVKPTSTGKAKPATSSTRSTTTSTSPRSKPVTLESKVARLEKNDARQDQRLNYLEIGQGGQGQGHGGEHGQGGVYTVRAGDTLWRIADKHNTSINELKAANRITGETITVGQSLIIPGYSSVSLPQDSHSGGAHIVRPGDTFSQIAQAHGVTLDTLARANPTVYPDRLLVGERIVIPGQKTGTTPAVLPQDRHVMSARLHIVKPGESLGAIAKGYGVSTASMVSANKLKNANVITPGQKLLVPGGSAAPAPRNVPSYPPADSDTVPLPGAGLYATTTQAPVSTPTPQFATPSAPAPEPVPAPKPASAPVSSNRRGIVAYRLERGDDINTVSNLFNTTPERIRELNKMAPDAKLKEGDEVVVPSLGAVSLN